MKISEYENLKLVLNQHGYLRPLQESDVTQAYVDGLNDPEVHQFLVGPRKQKQNMETVREFVRANREAEDSFLLGLYVNGVLRGTTRLHNVTTDEVTLGLAVFDKSVWGQGWGRLMLGTASQYALDVIGVKKINAGIEVDNIASQKVFRAAGYKCRNTMRSDLYDVDIQAWEFTGNN